MYTEIMNMEQKNLESTCKKMDLSSLIELSNCFYDLYYEKQNELEEYINILHSDDISDLMRMQYIEMRSQIVNELSKIWEKYEIVVLEIGEKFLKQIGITDKLVLVTYKKDFKIMATCEYSASGIRCKKMIKITKKGIETLFCMKDYILTGIANKKAIFSHKDATDGDVLKCVSVTAHLFLRSGKRQNPLY